MCCRCTKSSQCPRPAPPGASPPATCPGAPFHFSSASAWPWIPLIRILTPGLTSQAELRPALSLWAYLAIPGLTLVTTTGPDPDLCSQPGACLFTMDLHSDRDPWLTLAAFFRPARLFSMWGRTSSIKVLALVSHLVHHLLESSWVFLLPNTTV